MAVPLPPPARVARRAREGAALPPRWDPCVGSYVCDECGHRWAHWESRERHGDGCPGWAAKANK